MLSPKQIVQSLKIGFTGDVIRGIATELNPNDIEAFRMDSSYGRVEQKMFQKANPGDWLVIYSNLSMMTIATPEQLWADFEIDPVDNPLNLHLTEDERKLTISVRHKE